MSGQLFPAVTAIILNSHGEVLLTLRSAKVLFPGKWCLPGGRLDGGQTWLDAMKLEVKEEVGLEVLQSKLIGIYSDPKLHLVEVQGAKMQFLSACFLVTEFNGEPHINDESDEWDWFCVDNLPEPMMECEVPKIRDAVEYRGKPFVR